MQVVAFLQNAWSQLYAGGTWPRASWLKALAKSRTGKRLRVLLTRAKLPGKVEEFPPESIDN